jgi:hypothetical protein
VTKTESLDGRILIRIEQLNSEYHISRVAPNIMYSTTFSTILMTLTSLVKEKCK